ncbi:peptide ABC transporter substrate-binding protein [Puniceicoccales bacterium CK1056]|uniref:Peptide ABC transporter substrate-binding protein n=1 Tax=Oceanipulchritudo coccoides TaxID=2706888 RepID=A0A6B2M497_9BACT|nr:peptide ABC transporter substrate-binding protein [Oceanipulchritudo coccoides]NDV62470.1 peptide ABC transporter substrate-binding protein [Oceanipulchritudo coccoides]
MTRSKINFFSLITVLLGLLSVAGCGKREDAVIASSRDGILLFNNGAEPRDLDPHVVTGMPENRVIKSLLEGLVREHPESSDKVLPGMAERWESNLEKSIWTFHLREAYWTNGDPVTADDFAYSYSRILNPEFGAPYVSMLFRVKNAEAYNTGQVTDFGEVGIKVLGPRTLQVELDGPTPYLPLMLTHYTWFPLHRATIEKAGGFASRDSGWTLPGNYVGNGPFVLKEWLPNQRIIVEKNPGYWDAGSVALNGIHFFPIQDRQTENRMFQTGQLHITNGVPFNLRDKYRQENNPALREDPMFATGYLGLNNRHEGLDDPRVRHALSMALDRKTIIDKVTKNGSPAGGFVPPTIGGYALSDALPYDPEAARQLLAEAGYPGGEGLPEFEFMIANSDTSRTFAEVVQEMWRTELGVSIEILNKEWQVLIAEMDSGNYDIFLLSWIGDYLDPATFLKIMRTGDGNNRTGYGNPAYDALLAKANQVTSIEERYALLAEAEAILLADLPILPITWARNMYLIHPDVQGWASKALMDQPYESVRLVPGE